MNNFVPISAQSAGPNSSGWNASLKTSEMTWAASDWLPIKSGPEVLG
jgi:hypothetical protein